MAELATLVNTVIKPEYELSPVADGATAVAFDYDTANAFTTGGALLARVRNAGVDKFRLDKDGNLSLAGDATITALGTNRLILMSSGGARRIVLSNFSVVTTTSGVATVAAAQFGWTATANAENALDSGLKRSAAAIVGITNGSTGGGALELQELTAPAGAANHARIYAEDNGSGKTRLMVIFGSGASQQLAIEP